LKTHFDVASGVPGAYVSYVRYSNTDHALLVLGFIHGVGDGRAVEIALSQLLLLYDGRHAEVPFGTRSINYGDLIGFNGNLEQDKIDKWKVLEQEFPPRVRNSIHETFVQSKHPSFEAKFEGVCIELLRIDATTTSKIQQLSRSAGTTVTGTVAAALHHATLLELHKRGLETDVVSLMLLMNFRQLLPPEYMQELGNFITMADYASEIQSDFWQKARRVRTFLERIIEDDLGMTALAIQSNLTSREHSMMMQHMSSELLAAAAEHSAHCGISSLGFLKNFGKYESFQVLENIQASHILFSGLVCNLCTSGSSGAMTITVEVTKNVVPEARSLAVAIKNHLQDVLTNLPPVPKPGSRGENEEESPVAMAYKQSCESFEPLIEKNRLRLANAPRTSDGATALMGDVSGAYNCKTHIAVFLTTVFAILSAGPMTAFPLFEAQLSEAGVFNWACEVGEHRCPAQDVKLQNLYASMSSVSMALMISVGYSYDWLGGRGSSAMGAALAGFSFVVLAVATSLDGKMWPWTQTLCYYAFLIIADLGGIMASFSLFGFMWHYPLSQTFIVGLSNAATQASGALGLLFQAMAAAGYTIQDSYLLLALFSFISAGVFMLLCPSKMDTLTQAARVLNETPASLDIASMAGWLHLKHSVKESFQILKLNKLLNASHIVYIGFFLAGMLLSFGGLQSRYEAWFEPEDASMLLEVFGTCMGLFGIFLNPIVGIIIDRCGLLRVYTASGLLAIICLLTFSVANVSVQLIFILSVVTWFGIFMNMVAKWGVYFSPPDFFGTSMGVAMTVAGTMAWILNTTLSRLGCSDLFVIGLEFSLGTIAWMNVVGNLCRTGLPMKPPKNRYF